ncbi:cell division protein [Candidatus Rickettsiella isopodorum]|jgi:cell division protein FtsI (penicillin-binding protein 3)|uniref:Peptidoglycan D,D-transpeptidase FtsI n=1 Tax=Candidatus Rickettsiella isopodorum TaxID=1225476 RepID=A0A1J8NJ03_9COXI|nr:penicillin-binding protein 2 [Candidatus Rickettsiella isopodorum]OIZ95144.1 cell division protein [Candidatus Rickettsiella isopodorum]
MQRRRVKKNKRTPIASTYQWRLMIVVFILLIVALGLIGRLINLTIVNRQFLRNQGNARTVRTLTIPAHRGMILDRRGEPLAISTPVDAIWIDPAYFKPNRQQLSLLSHFLHINPQTIHEIGLHGQFKEFVYLKRGLNPSLAKQIKDLKIPGLFLQNEYHRYYPEGPVMAHVVGLTNVDDKGQEGLELAYNNWLEGQSGLKKVIKDRLGHVVADIRSIRQPRPGHQLQLSIDKRIQYAAFRELKTGIERYQADSGSVVVLDVKTGEILAMANWPSYNPNDRLTTQDGHTRNRALTDLFEPGSTIKSFSMASVLASSRFTPSSQIDTSPGWMIVAGKRIMDERNNGVMDLTKILQISSNMGMSKLILSLPAENLWNTLNTVGFGQITQSGFPGERTGSLPNFKVWNPFVLATLSFGYGISVTALQLAQAYAVLADGGVKVPVTFLKIQGDAPSGQRVLDKTISREVLDMLESVLTKGGTAPLARVPGYRVTGKTGTVRIVGVHGYEKHRYNSIFIGIAPASHPRLVVAVVLHDPKGRLYYGGYTAGPIFSHVMNNALHLLNIPPDDLASLNQPLPHVMLPSQGMQD